MNRNVTKTWKRRGRKRARSTGNPNHTPVLMDRVGKGDAKRRIGKVQRRRDRRKRLPDG